MRRWIPWSIRPWTLLVGLLCGAVPCVNAQGILPAASFDLPGETAALGDLDRDGKLDLAGESLNGYALAKGDGLGGFAAPVAWDSGLTFFSADSVDLVDVDSSGTLDVALFGHSTTATVGSRIVVRLADAAGVLGPAVLSPPEGQPFFPRGFFAVFAKLDADAFIDVVIAPMNLASGLTVARGSASGQFTATATLSLVEPSIVEIFAADLDGDLDNDLLLTHATDKVSTFTNDGSGAFGPQVTILTGVLVSELADVDGDSLLDLVDHFDVDDLLLWRGLLGGSFAAPISVLSSPPYADWQAIDLDGDELMDLVGGDLTSHPDRVWIDARRLPRRSPSRVRTWPSRGPRSGPETSTATATRT